MFIEASSYVQATNFPTRFDVRICCGACCNCCRLLASLFVCAFKTCRWTLHRPLRMQAFEAAMDAGAEDVQRVEGEDDAAEGYKARSLKAVPRLVCGIACCPVPWMQAGVRSMSNFDVAASSCGLFRDSCLSRRYQTGGKLMLHTLVAVISSGCISDTVGVQVLTSADEFASVRDSLRALGIHVAEDRSGLVFSPLTAIEARSPALSFSRPGPPALCLQHGNAFVKRYACLLPAHGQSAAAGARPDAFGDM